MAATPPSRSDRAGAPGASPARFARGAGPTLIQPLALLAIYTEDDRPARQRLETVARGLELRLEDPHTTAERPELPGTPLADVRDGQNHLVGWVRHQGGAQSLPEVADAAAIDERLREGVSRARGAYVLGIVPGGADPYTTVTRALRLGEALTRGLEGLALDLCTGRPVTPAALRMLSQPREAQVDDHLTVHALPARKGGGLWVHTHGMEKFAAPNLEAFDVGADAADAVSHFLVLLGDELVLGDGPELDGSLEVDGGVVRLRPAEAVRGSGSRRPACPQFKSPSLVAVNGDGGGPVDPLATARMGGGGGVA